jgi:hypothetical protein
VYINNLSELTVELNTLRVPGGHVCRFASANAICRNKTILRQLSAYGRDEQYWTSIRKDITPM